MLYKINFLVNGISHANLVEASNIELAKSFFIKEHLTPGWRCNKACGNQRK